VFLVWRGWGFLGLLLPAISILVMWVVADLALGPGSYEKSGAWGSVGLGMAGILCVAIGRRFNGEPVPYLARSVVPGEAFRPRVPFLFARHNLFFIPIEAIGVLWIAIGIVAIVRDVFDI
jgi:hypothetical protein